MQKLKCLLTGCLLALAVSFGFSAALSTPSFATSVYTFTYTGASYGNDGLEFTLNGSFSFRSVILVATERRFPIRTSWHYRFWRFAPHVL